MLKINKEIEKKIKNFFSTSKTGVLELIGPTKHFASFKKFCVFFDFLKSIRACMFFNQK